nr:hypothetical protein [Marinobacter sp. LA51]
MQQLLKLFCSDVRQHHGKFIARQATDGVGGADAGAQRLGNLDQDVVADGVTVKVIDLFESIDVDEDHCTVALCIQDLLQVMLESATIADAGQWIIIGEPFEGFFIALALGKVDADGQNYVTALLVVDNGAGPVQINWQSLVVGKFRIQLDDLAVTAFQ